MFPATVLGARPLGCGSTATSKLLLAAPRRCLALRTHTRARTHTLKPEKLNITEIRSQEGPSAWRVPQTTFISSSADGTRCERGQSEFVIRFT